MVNLVRRGPRHGGGGIESAKKLTCHVRLIECALVEAHSNAMLRIPCNSL